MPETALLPPAALWIIAVAGGVSTVIAAWKVAIQPIVRKLRAAWRALERFLDDWNGEPAVPARAGHPGVPARHGVLARLDHQRDTLEQVRHEVLPNNGGSLRDAVDELDRRLTEHVDKSEREHADTRQAIDAMQAERNTIHATAVVKVEPEE